MHSISEHLWLCVTVAVCTVVRWQVTREGQETELRAKGRHDPCVVPRAVPMVEAMVAIVLADQMLQHYAQVRGACAALPARLPAQVHTTAYLTLDYMVL